MVIYLPVSKCFIFRAERVVSVGIHRVDMYVHCTKELILVSILIYELYSTLQSRCIQLSHNPEANSN